MQFASSQILRNIRETPWAAFSPYNVIFLSMLTRESLQVYIAYGNVCVCDLLIVCGVTNQLYICTVVSVL